MLYINASSGTQKIKVQYFIPKTDVDLEELNTFTNIVTDDWDSKLHTKYANSIVIQPIIDRNKDLNSSDFTNISYSTSFINNVVGTKTYCKNIIAGGSKYGAYALKTAAQENVYQAAICVNNAAIVRDVNGVRGTKTQFASIDELKGLDGKDIYFVSTKNDPNLFYNKDIPWTSGSKEPAHTSENLKKGYLYTGVQTVLANCPKSQVYMITNSDKDEAFKNLSNSSNYHYNPQMWSDIGFGEYNAHGDYSKVIKDLMVSYLAYNNNYTNA